MPQSKTEPLGFISKQNTCFAIASHNLYFYLHSSLHSIVLFFFFFHQDMQKQKSNFTQVFINSWHLKVFVGSGHSSLSLVSNIVTSSVCAPNDPQTYTNFPSLLSDHKTGFKGAVMPPPFNSEASPCIIVFFFPPKLLFFVMRYYPILDPMYLFGI